MLLSEPPPVTERGLAAEDLSTTLPGGPSGAAAIHFIAHAQLVLVLDLISEAAQQSRRSYRCSTRCDR